MTITHTIPPRDGYPGLTEATTPCGRTIVVCGPREEAEGVLRGYLAQEVSETC